MTAAFIAASWSGCNSVLFNLYNNGGIMSDCFKCGKKDLSGDEIAIYLKLVNRGAKEFLCIACLAEFFQCDKIEIEKRIKYYRDSGECTLFV